VPLAAGSAMRVIQEPKAQHHIALTLVSVSLAHGILRRKGGISSGSPPKGSGGAIGGASATGRDDIESGAPIGCGRVFAAVMRASSGRSMLIPTSSFRWVSATASARCLASSRLTDDKIGNVQGCVQAMASGVAFEPSNQGAGRRVTKLVFVVGMP
jgi:hypothetical protein